LLKARHKILIAIIPKSRDKPVENLFRPAGSAGFPSLHKEAAAA
jgi:hypothetical protein